MTKATANKKVDMVTSSNSVYDRVRSWLIQSAVELSRQFIRCTRCEDVFLLHAAAVASSSVSRYLPFRCAGCSPAACVSGVSCKGKAKEEDFPHAHWPLTCAEFRTCRNMLPEEFRSLDVDGGSSDRKSSILGHIKVKFCPSCNEAIEKNGGCNHMRCQACGAHFCWLCGMEFKIGPLHPTYFKCLNRTHLPKYDARELSRTSSVELMPMLKRLVAHHSACLRRRRDVLREIYQGVDRGRVRYRALLRFGRCAAAFHHVLALAYAFAYTLLKRHQDRADHTLTSKLVRKRELYKWVRKHVMAGSSSAEMHLQSICNAIDFVHKRYKTKGVTRAEPSASSPAYARWRRAWVCLEDKHVATMSDALREVVRAIAHLRRDLSDREQLRFDEEEEKRAKRRLEAEKELGATLPSSSSSSSGSLPPYDALTFTGVGNPNSRRVVVGSRSTFRDFLEHDPRGQRHRSNIFLTHYLRARPIRRHRPGRYNIEHSFVRERFRIAKMGGIKGFLGRVSGSFVPDPDEYTFVKLRPWNTARAKERHARDRTRRDPKDGLTKRERRRAKKEERRMRRGGGSMRKRMADAKERRSGW